MLSMIHMMINQFLSLVELMKMLLELAVFASLISVSSEPPTPIGATVVQTASGTYTVTIGSYSSTVNSLSEAATAISTWKTVGPYPVQYTFQSGATVNFVSSGPNTLMSDLTTAENSLTSTTSTSSVTSSSTGPPITPAPYPTGPNLPKVKCFSADSTVVTNKGRMSMADLYKLSSSEDLQILTVGGKFSPIAFWLHAEPQKSAEFLRLTTVNGQSISVTRGHLVFKTDCDRFERQSVRAEKISLGDYLMVDNGYGQLEAQPVFKVEKFNSIGFYSPVTVSGDLLVNNILTSCYSEVEAVQLQSIMFGYVDIFKSSTKHFLYNSLFSAMFGQQDTLTGVSEVVRHLLWLSSLFIV